MPIARVISATERTLGGDASQRENHERFVNEKA
jgi:hypothetical protein